MAKDFGMPATIFLIFLLKIEAMSAPIAYMYRPMVYTSLARNFKLNNI
jgi:hypothetical protein